MTEHSAEAEQISAGKPVVRRVLEAFISAVALEKDQAEVAERLRAALLNDGARTENALRTALFGGSDK